MGLQVGAIFPGSFKYIAQAGFLFFGCVGRRLQDLSPNQGLNPHQ